jgi:hypothetical protein
MVAEHIILYYTIYILDDEAEEKYLCSQSFCFSGHLETASPKTGIKRIYTHSPMKR